MSMDYGVHLPLIGFNGGSWPLERLLEYTETAKHLGFRAIAANDHLDFPRPKLDALIALAAVLTHSGEMALVTSVALPVVRGPVPLAKSLAALDLLSDGRLVIGLGAGARPTDYVAVNIPFEERWKRFDEAVEALRALLWKEASPFKGEFYSTVGLNPEPYPAQQPGPPLWIGSWGSEAGLRRTARLGDGWIASALGATPEVFAEVRQRLSEHLRRAGRDPEQFPHAISTVFLHITEDRTVAERILRDILVPLLNRPEDTLRERVLIGPVRECAEKLTAYAAAGAQRLFLWPVADELHQLRLFREQVDPLVSL